MKKIKTQLISDIIDIYKTERVGVINNPRNSTLSGDVIEHISFHAWSTLSYYFNINYDKNFSVKYGVKNKILCMKPNTHMYKHADIQIYDGNEVIHGEECKVRCDNPWMGSLIETSYSIRNFSVFNSSLSMLSLYKDSNITNIEFYCDDDLIDDVFILTGRGNRDAWSFPLLDFVLENYVDYIFNLYRKRL